MTLLQKNEVKFNPIPATELLKMHPSHEWGPEVSGAHLWTDGSTYLLDPNKLTSFDVETDEKDNFVGIAICQEDDRVYYWSELTLEVRLFLKKVKQFVAHSIKFDAGCLKKWGIPVTSEQLSDDTVIMSYCINTNKDSHHLKDLARENLGLIWPTYKEMVGTGAHKQTLDKQPVEKVAPYCGMDALACFRLYHFFNRVMTSEQKLYYHKIEMPITRMLFDMENEGIMVSKSTLQKLDKKFGADEEKLRSYFIDLVGPVLRTPEKVLKNGKVKEAVYEDFNPSSWYQVSQHLLPMAGIKETKTGKNVLWNYISNPVIQKLFEHRKLSKLITTYTHPLLHSETFPMIHTTFSQVRTGNHSSEARGIRTGRLSSSHPNLQNIPARKPYGPMVRKAFIASPGKHLICADYSQIEYRLLAHFSQAPILVEAYKNGEDIHQTTADIFGVERDVGKTLNFAAIYGAHGKRVAQTVSQSGTPLSEAAATKLLEEYWQKLPEVSKWIGKVKFEARYYKGVRTLFGRWIPLPDISSKNIYDRWHWERAAVNYVIQGSAAEIIKVAMLKLWQEDFLPKLQVHDELIFETEPKNVKEMSHEIKELMVGVARLVVPLEVEVGSGPTWAKAKA